MSDDQRDEFYIRHPGDRWEKVGPRTDALALADAMSAVVHAAEEMSAAGDLAPIYIEDLHTARAEARRLALFEAIQRLRAIRGER